MRAHGPRLPELVTVWATRSLGRQCASRGRDLEPAASLGPSKWMSLETGVFIPGCRLVLSGEDYTKWYTDNGCQSVD